MLAFGHFATTDLHRCATSAASYGCQERLNVLRGVNLISAGGLADEGLLGALCAGDRL